MQTLWVKRLSEHAVMPSRGSQHAAGYDLSSARDATIGAHARILIPTDLAIAIPEGTYARIAPRSGLALKKGIDVGAGVVDYDYRGPIGVILFNHGEEEMVIRRGDRIAQLILEQIATPEVKEAQGELPSTERGGSGFGSTGN